MESSDSYEYSDEDEVIDLYNEVLYDSFGLLFYEMPDNDIFDKCYPKLLNYYRNQEQRERIELVDCMSYQLVGMKFPRPNDVPAYKKTFHNALKFWKMK